MLNIFIYEVSNFPVTIKNKCGWQRQVVFFWFKVNAFSFTGASYYLIMQVNI